MLFFLLASMWIDDRRDKVTHLPQESKIFYEKIMFFNVLFQEWMWMQVESDLNVSLIVLHTFLTKTP